MEYLAIGCYLASCFFYYLVASFSRTFDENISVKNIVLTITWPLSMWFLK